MVLPDKDKIIPKKITLSQDDFIEWILTNTKEESEFRIYRNKNHTLVGIDGECKNDED
ncbi:hypothetical protein LCGC14_0383410 [marine sediment metagenome]|uniref:Uncharacterized protein n=1 Tax=marine sediment metagenome TaxID=412755 RepID=A0A0F9TJU4_9ZZZZ